MNECPSCKEPINIVAFAEIPNEQKVVLSIKHQTKGVSAKTVGGTIVSMDKLLRAVAKDIGEEVSVLIAGITHENSEINITFVIAKVKKP